MPNLGTDTTCSSIQSKNTATLLPRRSFPLLSGEIHPLAKEPGVCVSDGYRRFPETQQKRLLGRHLRPRRQGLITRQTANCCRNSSCLLESSPVSRVPCPFPRSGAAALVLNMRYLGSLCTPDMAAPTMKALRTTVEGAPLLGTSISLAVGPPQPFPRQNTSHFCPHCLHPYMQYDRL